MTLDRLSGRCSPLSNYGPPHRIVNPDQEVCCEAGILARTVGPSIEPRETEQRRALNDALKFLSAVKHGCSVLTRNIADSDFLMELAPHANAVFYDRVP